MPDDGLEILELEERGWRALATAGDAGRRFYAEILRDDAEFLLPGMRLEGRERIVESLGAQPWESFRIEEPKIFQLGADVAVITYRARARRAGAAEYLALISSTYVRRDGWRLAMHQQTPIQEE